MQRAIASLISLCATIALLAAGTAACTAAPQSSGSAPPGSSGPSAARTGATPAASGAPAAGVRCAGGWRTTPVAVARQVSVPPVPVVTAVRTGSHPGCRFDRVVIDINGPLPGYTVTFVSKVIQEASGRPISMPGARYLLIKIRPAQGHPASGAGGLPARPRALSYPMLKGYAVAGDFEGVLTIALGLARGTRFRVRELTGRLYLDLSW